MLFLLLLNSLTAIWSIYFRERETIFSLEGNNFNCNPFNLGEWIWVSGFQTSTWHPTWWLSPQSPPPTPPPTILRELIAADWKSHPEKHLFVCLFVCRYRRLIVHKHLLKKMAMKEKLGCFFLPLPFSTYSSIHRFNHFKSFFWDFFVFFFFL